MTAADRLRTALEAALPCACLDGTVKPCPRARIHAVLAAALPIVEELERERDALRAATNRGNARTRKKTHRHIHFTDEDGCVHPCRCGEPYRDAAMKGERDGW